MKTVAKTLAVLLLVGLFGSSCAAVNRLNTEYEEETTRVQQMSPEEKAEWENNQKEERKIELRGYFDDGDSSE
jgi:hypothetical protein